MNSIEPHLTITPMEKILERWEGPEEETGPRDTRLPPAPVHKCPSLADPSSQPRVQRPEPWEIVSGRPFPKARSISTGPTRLVATSVTMTSHVVLVKDSNVLAHWESGWSGRGLCLEDSHLAHPAPIPGRFGAARRKSFRVLELSIISLEGFV